MRWIGVGLGIVMSAGLDLLFLPKLTFAGLCAMIVIQALYLGQVASGRSPRAWRLWPARRPRRDGPPSPWRSPSRWRRRRG